MTHPATLDELVLEALEVGDVQSAALIVVETGSNSLGLAAAAGITGAALDGLMAAVQNRAHPVALALTDDGPTFDVPPMAPGGPALRSHLPVRTGDRTMGVLALAHDLPLPGSDRETLIGLSAAAATLLAITER